MSGMGRQAQPMAGQPMAPMGGQPMAGGQLGGSLNMRSIPSSTVGNNLRFVETGVSLQTSAGANAGAGASAFTQMRAKGRSPYMLGGKEPPFQVPPVGSYDVAGNVMGDITAGNWEATKQL